MKPIVKENIQEEAQIPVKINKQRGGPKEPSTQKSQQRKSVLTQNHTFLLWEIRTRPSCELTPHSNDKDVSDEDLIGIPPETNRKQNPIREPRRQRHHELKEPIPTTSSVITPELYQQRVNLPNGESTLNRDTNRAKTEAKVSSLQITSIEQPTTTNIDLPWMKHVEIGFNGSKKNMEAKIKPEPKDNR